MCRFPCACCTAICMCTACHGSRTSPWSIPLSCTVEMNRPWSMFSQLAVFQVGGSVLKEKSSKWDSIIACRATAQCMMHYSSMLPPEFLHSMCQFVFLSTPWVQTAYGSMPTRVRDDISQQNHHQVSRIIIRSAASACHDGMKCFYDLPK